MTDDDAAITEMQDLEILPLEEKVFNSNDSIQVRVYVI